MGVDAAKLKYLGVEGHWKVYYVEGSLSTFIYASAKPSLVYNCIYEVQFYKSKVGLDLFGPEIVFEGTEGTDLAGFAVKVTRPSIFLDDFVGTLWTQMSDQCQECHSDLKVHYILFQVCSLVKRIVVDRRLEHDCLSLRAFHINRHNWEIGLSSFAFCRPKSSSVQRGSISGCSSD